MMKDDNLKLITARIQVQNYWEILKNEIFSSTYFQLAHSDTRYCWKHVHATNTHVPNQTKCIL